MKSRSEIENELHDRQGPTADPLASTLEGLGDASETAKSNAAAVDTVRDWLDRAEHRPAWLLWGKARPLGACPAHPLLCHMADVAAVAGRLLTRTLPRSVRTRLLTLDGLSETEALRFILLVVALHDFGKASPAFQTFADSLRAELSRRGLDLDSLNGTHHSTSGVLLVQEALAALGAEAGVALSLARAVTAHHGEFPTDASIMPLRNSAPREQGTSPLWAQARQGVVEELRALFRVERVPTVESLDHAFVVLLAGLTSVADWIGSMQEVFEYEPPQPALGGYWPTALARADLALERVGMRATTAPSFRSFGSLFPALSPWPLHEAAEAIARRMDSPSLVIVEAPMGEGKTEAALLLAEAAAAKVGSNGLYVGLPTQATANQMFGRVKRFLDEARGDEHHNLLLAHGESSLVPAFRQIQLPGVYDPQDAGLGSVRAEAWFNESKKRALLGTHAVGTIDQALLGVMRVPHAFVRMFGLAGKTVVLDEVHAYDTYTGSLLERLIEWLAAAGTTVVLLSATLPSPRRAALVKAYRSGAGLPLHAADECPYPRITTTSSRGTITTSFRPRGASVSVVLEHRPDDISAAAHAVVEAAREGGCIGWICNTVARAQAACEAVRTLAPEIDRLLIHARLLPDDRLAREQQLECWLGPESRTRARPERCIVIGTQVLEQSLDVDFDLLFTDVAPIDLVLQRAGRLHRHARTNRHPARPAPRLVVVRPEGSWSEAKLDQVAVVYAELLVRRTLRALETRDRITLPDDIEPLVEAVYSDAVPPADDQLFGAFIEHYGGKAAERGQAVQRLMPRPTVEDDPFGDLQIYMGEDEDPAIHAALRAVTRLGPPSLEIVCLELRGPSVVVGDEDPKPFDLGAPPDRALVSRLVRRSISVTMPTLVRTLISDTAARPASWERNALLRYRRIVFFEEDRADVGNIHLRLEPELGLCITRDGTSSKEPA